MAWLFNFCCFFLSLWFSLSFCLFLLTHLFFHSFSVSSSLSLLIFSISFLLSVSFSLLLSLLPFLLHIEDTWGLMQFFLYSQLKILKPPYSYGYPYFKESLVKGLFHYALRCRIHIYIPPLLPNFPSLFPSVTFPFQTIPLFLENIFHKIHLKY